MPLLWSALCTRTSVMMMRWLKGTKSRFSFACCPGFFSEGRKEGRQKQNKQKMMGGQTTCKFYRR
jgi:hypothetical protein